MATRVIGWSVESSSRRAWATRSFLTMLLKVRPVARLKYLEKVGSDMYASRAAVVSRMSPVRLEKM